MGGKPYVNILGHLSVTAQTNYLFKDFGERAELSRFNSELITMLILEQRWVHHLC